VEQETFFFQRDEGVIKQKQHLSTRSNVKGDEETLFIHQDRGTRK
jgi:hypothetical protein